MTDLEKTPAQIAADRDAEAARVRQQADAKAAAAKAAAKKPLIQVAEPAPNPPEQPKMIPAKQVPGATGDYLDARSIAKPRTAGIKVVATRMGYYADKLQRVGDVFTIQDETEFSDTWMARVAASTPEQTTGSNKALQREHDALVGGTVPHGGNVLGDD